MCKLIYGCHIGNYELNFFVKCNISGAEEITIDCSCWIDFCAWGFDMNFAFSIVFNVLAEVRQISIINCWAIFKVAIQFEWKPQSYRQFAWQGLCCCISLWCVDFLFYTNSHFFVRFVCFLFLLFVDLVRSCFCEMSRFIFWVLLFSVDGWLFSWRKIAFPLKLMSICKDRRSIYYRWWREWSMLCHREIIII